MTSHSGPSLQDSTASSLVSDRRLQVLRDNLETLVTDLRGDGLALLGLLRELEHLHRQIEQGAFREALPKERNGLYQLLQEMERSGGWPYIPRPQLRRFLNQQDTPPGGQS